MSLTEPLQVEDAASLRRRGKQDNDNIQKNDDNHDNTSDNQSSTQISTSEESGIPATLTSFTSGLVATTTLLSSPTRTILPASISAIPEIPPTFTSTSSPPFAAISTISTPSASSSSGPSRTTTVVVAVVAAGAGAAIVVILLLCIYKSLSRRSKFTPVFARLQRVRSQDTSSMFWGSSQSGSTTVEEIPPSVPPMTYNMANSAVDRQERLGLVKDSLLRLRERDEFLIRSQSQSGIWQSERRSEGQGSEGQGNEDGVNEPNGNWQGIGVSEGGRLHIEAGGRWEAPVTIAARDSLVESVISTPRWGGPIMWVRDKMGRNKRCDAEW